MIVGTIIQVTAFKGHNATAQFVIGCIVTGVGNGMNTATIPTYQAECSRTKNHGLLICIEGGVIAFGTLIASPRWLLTKDRHEDAAKVIAALRGHAIDDSETRFEAHIIMDSIRASGHKGGITPFSALFTNGKTQHFRRMMLGASSQLMQQIGGCNAVIYYFLSSSKTQSALRMISSLEEIDLIFAKGFVENMSYVKVAKELPFLDPVGIEQMQREYGFFDDDTL
ncbi:unnamed protein product [Alternaria alternata]